MTGWSVRAGQTGESGGQGGDCLTEGHPLDLGVGEGYAQVVKGEHAVEGHDQELDLVVVGQPWRSSACPTALRAWRKAYEEVAREEQREAQIVGGIRFLR